MIRHSKICRTCKTEKSLQEFYNHPTYSDGLMIDCKECKRVYAREMTRKKGLKGRGKTIEERIIRLPEAGCWIWMGGLDKNGYGIMTTNVLAHRAVYEQHCGSIPYGLCVCHRCDVRCCVNPAHLFLGSNFDNSQDCMRKGRQARGERNGLSKLTEQIVRDIRLSNESIRSLARKYKVTPRAIRLARLRETWMHIA